MKNNVNYVCPHFHLIVFALIATAICGCDAESRRKFEAVASQADGKVSNFVRREDTRFVNGELDYGFTLTFIVENKGKAGIIKIMPWLSCSEGEWTRTQNLQFEAGESKNLTYFFHEPTINSENVQSGVKISP
jgi:hypothetical protein